MTTTYVELFPVRIQQYITRWPDLKGRRGASAMLARATKGADFATFVTSIGAKPNPHAVSIDGAVSVVVDDPDQVDQVKRRLIERLRFFCPAAEYVAVSASGTDYWQLKLERLDRASVLGQADPVLAPAYEVPTVRRCLATGSDPSIGAIDISGIKRLVGLDASRRVEQYYADSPELALATELGLVTEVEAHSYQVDDFASLASLGPKGRKRNHLATVFADGNKIGALMEGLLPRQRGPVSEALKKATFGSLADATRAVARICDSTQKLPIVVHILGGDDVLVSVPAWAGLDFARSFSTNFSTRVAAKVNERVSTSTAIVYHHQSFPFNRVADLAGSALTTAKSTGDQPALLAIDTTRSNSEQDRRDLVWSLTDIAQCSDELGSLAAEPQSFRSSLSRASQHPEDLVAQARTTLLLARHGLTDRYARFSTPNQLARALQLTRWWFVPDDDAVAAQGRSTSVNGATP